MVKFYYIAVLRQKIFAVISSSFRYHQIIVTLIISGRSSHWLKRPQHGLRTIITGMAENLRDVWEMNACNNSTSTLSWIWNTKSILILWEGGKASNSVTEYFTPPIPNLQPILLVTCTVDNEIEDKSCSQKALHVLESPYIWQNRSTWKHKVWEK